MDRPSSWFLLAKCVKKHLWKSDILRKDAGQEPASLVKMILTKDAGYWPVSLIKMSLYHRCFSHILLEKINYLASSCEEHWNI